MSERFNELDRHEREPKPSVLQELNTLRESFGFAENEELADLHQGLLLAAGQEHADLRGQLTGMYQDQARTIIDTDSQPDKWHGAAIALAAIKLESGRITDCLADLEDIYYTLRQDPRFEDAADRVDAIMRHLENSPQ